MRRHSWLLVVAMMASPSIAQQPQARRDGTQEGFFRPETAPALRTLPEPAAPDATLATRRAEPVAPLPKEPAVQARERESPERELDRAEREHARAQADAPRPVVPLIVSPLDGTAPIVSPLGR